MPDPTLRRRLLPVLSVPIVVALVLAGMALHTQWRDHRRLLDTQIFSKRAIAAGHATASLLDFARGVEALPLALAPAQRNEWEAHADSAAGRLERFLDELEQTFIFEASLSDVQRLRAALSQYRQIHMEVLAQSQAQALDAALAAMQRSTPLVAEMHARLHAIKARVQSALDAIALKGAKDAEVTWTVTLAVSVGGILLSLGLTLWIALRGGAGHQARHATGTAPAAAGLGAAIGDLDHAAHRLRDDIDGYLHRAGTSPAIAAEAEACLERFAAAAESLATSVGAITREVSEATMSARRAAAGAELAQAAILGLNETASQIGTLIRSIGQAAPGERRPGPTATGRRMAC